VLSSAVFSVDMEICNSLLVSPDGWKKNLIRNRQG
jgi:hypothetical protein